MIIDINETSGFCAGVRNALNMLDKEIASNKYKAIYYIEEIVHNEEIINKYNKLGLRKIDLDNLGSIDRSNSLIVLSAHGTSDKLKNRLKGFKLLDTTCPFVRLNQDLARTKENVIYIGKKNHAESIAVTDDLSNYIIVEKIDDINLINKDIDYLVVNQTTYNKSSLEKIHNEILNINPNNIIKNTLCPTTIKNQESVLDNSYDVLLVLGSRISNNLNTLFELSTIKNKYIIEKIDDLNNIDLKDNDKVLIVGSASTDPSFLITIKNEIIVKYKQ